MALELTMGAYLSEPKTEKESSDESNTYMTVGASCMQGWRQNQEDAHNCILNFDEKTSFFAVFDGHGGAEVAAYCADHFPDFLKQISTYKSGDFEQALKDAFLAFDQTLLKKDVIEILKKLAAIKNNDEDEDMAEEDDEEDLMELRQEGSLPLDQVLKKYKECANQLPRLKKIKLGEGSGSGEDTNMKSPYLRGRRLNQQQGTGTDIPSSSAFGGGCSSSQLKEKNVEVDDSIVSSSSGKPPVEKVKVNENNEINNEASSKENGKLVKCISPDSSSANSGDSKAMKVQNGDITSCGENEVSTNSPEKTEGISSSSSQMAEAAPASAAASSSRQGVSESSSADAVRDAPSSTKKRSGRNMPLVQVAEVDDSSSDDDADDADFKADDNSSTEDGEEDCDPCDDDEEEEDSDEEGCDEDISEDDEMEEDDEEEDAFCANMIEEPGKDSGCTAVVAVLHGRDLYVANAGDSRCVVCRNGEAIEMSLDHKPEDEIEKDRIVKAGGKVTADGRVNGGLNLSRAIGDHAYKMKEELPPECQMISALPDVKKLVISPKDEFMVLACDGIWNFMSSEEVVEFVKKRLDEGREKISQICEELFDHCLAPNTLNDGTGCDNMTAVIVRFNQPNILDLPTRISVDSEAVPIQISSKKRCASDVDISGSDENHVAENSSKRLKTADSNAVTDTVDNTKNECDSANSTGADSDQARPQEAVSAADTPSTTST